jgi:hypothetical protein
MAFGFREFLEWDVATVQVNVQIHQNLREVLVCSLMTVGTSIGHEESSVLSSLSLASDRLWWWWWWWWW